MINEIITLIEAHSFFVVLLYAVMLDTILGVGRAAKEKKFNSSVGIDGGIRKAMMVATILVLMLVDAIVHIDLLFMVPTEYLQVIGIDHMGICEFFCLLFILFEVISILKNMVLCGLPVPYKLRIWVMEFLDKLTDEMPEKERKVQ